MGRQQFLVICHWGLFILWWPISNTRIFVCYKSEGFDEWFLPMATILRVFAVTCIQTGATCYRNGGGEQSGRLLEQAQVNDMSENIYKICNSGYIQTCVPLSTSSTPPPTPPLSLPTQSHKKRGLESVCAKYGTGLRDWSPPEFSTPVMVIFVCGVCSISFLWNRIPRKHI